MEEDEKDKKGKAVKEVRKMIEDLLGLSPTEQNTIETFVVETIKETDTIFEAMAVLREQKGMDAESVFAGSVLGSLTAPTRKQICIAIPVDIMDVLHEYIDKNESKTGETDDAKVAR